MIPPSLEKLPPRRVTFMVRQWLITKSSATATTTRRAANSKAKGRSGSSTMTDSHK